eukprot:CAMPEP_0174888542 /NCGR_PEP_ID=MMETSP0167-20121228/3831_1 /TAXON_ID=38298 /ORGANISM="Rhodella maculata, Strain CCMP736" /LENGTH=72 /DNA_ID=CAMNT_0016125571 /DNA_START=451 /DNA_END=670 /DNA_ORIENTATION=-
MRGGEGGVEGTGWRGLAEDAEDRRRMVRRGGEQGEGAKSRRRMARRGGGWVHEEEEGRRMGNKGGGEQEGGA